MLQPRNSVVNFYRFCLTTLSILNTLSPNVKVIWRSALLGLVVSVAGCATLGIQPKEEIVRQRAQARADAVVEGNYKAVFEFYSPAARQLMSYETFMRTQRMGLWRSAKVDNVQCSSEELCQVDLTIEFVHGKGSFKGPLRQNWLKEQNNWWLVVREER